MFLPHSGDLFVASLIPDIRETPINNNGISPVVSVMELLRYTLCSLSAEAENCVHAGLS